MTIPAFLLGVVLAVAQAPAPPATVDLISGTGPKAAEGDAVAFTVRAWLQSDGNPILEPTDEPPLSMTLGEPEPLKEWLVETRGIHGQVGLKAPQNTVLGLGEALARIDQALVGAAKGTTRVFAIEALEAFGEEGFYKAPPGTNVVFEIEVIKVTPQDSGEPKIEIVELSEGTGEPTKAGDKVDVHYRGTFLNGEEFDASYGRGTPLGVTLGTGMVIKGFDEGLTGLKMGGRRRITIPYQLAYGAAGRPPVIPPMSTLVFEVEVVKITPGN